MGTVTFQRESIKPIWGEILPLLVDHWKEIATWSDIPLDPDVDGYNAMEDAGLLLVFTARDVGRLVGYAAYIVRPHPHYRTSKQAYQDVIYLTPEYRGAWIGSELIRYVDAELAREGVQVVFQHTKVAHDFGRMLEREGYFLVEKIYAKRIG